MLDIADAVAARFAAVATPTGETRGIQGATARTPNGIPATPYVVVELPSGDVGIPTGGRRTGEHVFDVYFLLDKASGNIPTDKVRLLRWLPGLIDATFAAMKLGLSTVMKSVVMSYEYGQYQYSGDNYHAWHFVVRVWTEDTVTVTP